MDMDMGMKLKKSCTPTTTSKDWSDSPVVDRFSTLPVELLIKILSLLPTKDVAATCVLSKWLMRHVFLLITNIDLDDSPICHCLEQPCGIERFPTFVTFVDSVLRNNQSRYLTRFRLGVGPNFMFWFHYHQKNKNLCWKECYPYLNPMTIHAWMSFPLSRCGLRVLELHIRVREGGHCQLSPEIFTCKTLEVLKLNVNFGFDKASNMPYFDLPNLKIFHLLGAFICEDSFLVNLVSSCSLLEDLSVNAQWNYATFASISSSSLRTLRLYMEDVVYNHHKSLVHINTPNLEHFDYVDNLPYQYCITNMDRLVKAEISIDFAFEVYRKDLSFQQMLGLIRPMINVQHLCLTEMCTEVLKYAKLEDHLPVFHNLKYLALGYPGLLYWDDLLLPFLNCSPALETLVFPKGFTFIGFNTTKQINEAAYMLEREFCRATLAVIPSCCRSHLKRIVIEGCFGSEREIDLIQFLLRHALVLEELAITFEEDQSVLQDQMTFESTVQNLPRASATCFIQVQQK